jgi:hypothetical protein
MVKLDNLIGVPYTLKTYAVNELSEILKLTLKDKYDIENFSSFSQESSEDNVDVRFPEIYEYQNFYIMERVDGSILLLDGFRRLLLYNNLPTFNVTVRVYKESDLPQTKLLKLMLMLNHPKFFGGNGNYYDKGFNLILFILYGIMPNRMKNIFEGYITCEEENIEGEHYFNYDNPDKLVNSHYRFLQPKTIEDLQFIYELSQVHPITSKIKFLGTAIYNTRLRNPDIKFNLKLFLELIDNDIVKKLESSNPSVNGLRETATLKKLMEMYINAIKTMCGEEIQETFEEANERYKNFKKVLKSKNKNLIALNDKTTNVNNSKIVKFLAEHKKSPKVYCLVKPNLSGNGLMEVDIYETVYIGEVTLSTHLMSTKTRFHLNFSNNDYPFQSFDSSISNRFGSGSRKYNRIELFVDLDVVTEFDIKIVDKRKQ